MAEKLDSSKWDPQANRKFLTSLYSKNGGDFSLELEKKAPPS